ncbi:hypothetical protein R3Q08_03440 [Rhodococcus erythropolis]|uniref:Uncharacterized protein n=1 Tax=Rhodococcus erythropolis TaxID=1833 RepID=A0AAX4A085_RHOER|nr:hypothetical protein [Rhodococcus erythropolis]MDV6207273.1 hypothetical protein [Rhodococcus erythropolis]WMN02073.1 hypothetical protein QIE55_30430 [Rhodococcus erythropolis]
MVDTTPDVPISPVDAASFQLGVDVQPYLVTIAGLLSRAALSTATVDRI